MKKLLLLTISTVIMISGCSLNKKLNSDTIIASKDTIYAESIQFLSGTKSTELDLFEDNLIIETSDYYLITDGTYTLDYMAYSAYYLQVDKYMYRFQINSDGLVESYIKYSVEA